MVSNTEYASCDPEPAHRFKNLVPTSPRDLEVEADLLEGSLNRRTVSYPVRFMDASKETRRAFNDNAGAKNYESALQRTLLKTHSRARTHTGAFRLAYNATIDLFERELGKGHYHLLTKTRVIKYLTTEKLTRDGDSQELFDHLRKFNLFVVHPWLEKAKIASQTLQHGVIDYFVRYIQSHKTRYSFTITHVSPPPPGQSAECVQGQNPVASL